MNTGIVRGQVHWRMFGKKNRDDNSPERLIELWTVKFGARPHDHLIASIEDWKMDRRGAFRFRMRGGRKLFVGDRVNEETGRTETFVESEGGFFSKMSMQDCWHIVLAQYSIGKRSIKIHMGTRKAKAQMWAAAKLMSMEIENYQPDRMAMEYLEELRQSFGR